MVVGSSLQVINFPSPPANLLPVTLHYSCRFQVYSGYRIVLQAREEVGGRVAILNIGPGRADAMADVVVNARAGEVLPTLRV